MPIANCAKTAMISPSRIGLFIAVLLAGCLLLSDAKAQSEPALASTNDGLKDLLPAGTPDRLLDAFNGFPSTWENWTTGVINELNAFYGETPSDIAGQRAALGRLKARLGTIDRSLADARYNSIRERLVDLRGAMVKRIEILEAVLDTLTDQEIGRHANSARLRLSATLENLNAFLAGAIGGDKWVTYLRLNEVRRNLLPETDRSKSSAVLKRSLRNLHFARGSGNPDVRALCQIPVFRSYLSDLQRTVTGVEHENSGVRWNDLRSEIKRLIGELEIYEADQLQRSADQVRDAYDRVCKLAPDGGDRLTWVLRQHFFNSNFQASFSEGFLNRVMSTSRVESGGVRDYILGADVYGNQTTASFSTVNLLPADSAAHLQIQLSGDVSANTEAFASKAVIYSVGNDHFDGVKDVFFDGTSFSTWPAILNVMASNVPVGASTQADRIPIFGGIARRIALRTANRNRPEAEAIAAQRVDSRVAPRFDSEVDSAFSQLNSNLQSKVALPLQSEQLYPDDIAARSSDSVLTLRTRLMSDGRLGGGQAPAEPIGFDDVLFSFHETLLNNALDLLPIAGKAMTESEFEQIVKQKVGKFLPRLNLSERIGTQVASDADEPKRIIFAEQDPLRVKFESGKMLLIIRAGFERDIDRGGNIPTQIVTIPWMISIVGSDLVMTRGDISVEALETAENIAQQVVMAGVIKSRLSKSFPSSSKAASTFRFERAGKDSIRLRVAGISLQNGWLTVRAAPEQFANLY